MRYPPLRHYLKRVLRDMGGISHWAAKSERVQIWVCLFLHGWSLPGCEGCPLKWGCSGDEKTNKHKPFLGIVPGMGRDQICLCFALSLDEKGNTSTKFPGNLGKHLKPGMSRDSFAGAIPGNFCFSAFSYLLFFSWP